MPPKKGKKAAKKKEKEEKEEEAEPEVTVLDKQYYLSQIQERLRSLQKEFSQTKVDLSDQILSLTRKLESLEEFRIQKEKIDANLKALEELLAKEREEHKEKISVLERSAIEEKESLIKDQNEKLAALTEQLREEARHEINATAKAAISQSDTQFKTISTLKSKIFKLRQENVELRNNFREQMTREAAMQELLRQNHNHIREKRSCFEKSYPKSLRTRYNKQELRKTC
ncbi:hypothetical protein Avbf_03205 [Armadillidium vulgare]|nr:hypothetical protein Avbf_03205 [Armadillidium vulgare]